MSRPLWIAAAIVGVGGIGSSTTFGTVTVSCTPKMPDGTPLVAPNGNDVVLFDCFMQTDVALTLRSYQVTYPCAATLGGGAGGSVDHLTIPGGQPCTFAGEDTACVFSGFQGICGNPTICFSPAQCGGGACLEDPQNPGVKYCQNSGTCSDPSPFVDDTRLDYVLRGPNSWTASVGIDACPGTLPLVAGTINAAGIGVALMPGVMKYVGSFYYRLSGCAVGPFSWNVVGNGNPPNATNATRFLNTANVAQLVLGSAAEIGVSAGLCCDGDSCIGNFNPYCCLEVQGGLISKIELTCTPPSFANCVCTTDTHCNDNNPCTTDFCAPGNPASNDVGCVNPSNVPGGYCCDPTGTGALDPLDDGNACTVDTCQGGIYPAVHDAPAANGDPCPDDGNLCTLDSCLNGQCIHDAPAANGATCASDGNVCTADLCSNGTCTHSASGANGQPCASDGVFCTLDLCNAGACVHTNINTLACETPSDCPSPCTEVQSGCTGSVGNPGLCVCMQPGGACYGDIYPLPTGDDLVNIDDILCSLGGFIQPSQCPQADIYPCTPNGIIDVDDITAMINAFIGFASCGCPCG